MNLSERDAHAVMLCVIIFLLGLVCISVGAAKARDGGQWAQLNLSPQQRKWFQDQVKPGTRAPCCNDADGEEVEEDIRDGEYWIKSKTTEGFTADGWVRVPPENVITEPNRWGQPIAWFRGKGTATLYVYCYSPGSLM